MMKHRTILVSVLTVVALTAAACSSSSEDASAPTTGAAASTTVVEEGSGGTDSTAPATTQATTTTTVAAEPVIVGADPIVQTTPTSGGGNRPLLEWDSIDGATLYFVTIYTETSDSYWAAVTEETKTYVGGPLQIPAGRTGPNVADGYTWVVYAEDADGTLLAVSPLRPIAP